MTGAPSADSFAQKRANSLPPAQCRHMFLSLSSCCMVMMSLHSDSRGAGSLRCVCCTSMSGGRNGEGSVYFRRFDLKQYIRVRERVLPKKEYFVLPNGVLCFARWSTVFCQMEYYAVRGSPTRVLFQDSFGCLFAGIRGNSSRFRRCLHAAVPVGPLPEWPGQQMEDTSPSTPHSCVKELFFPPQGFAAWDTCCSCVSHARSGESFLCSLCLIFDRFS